MPRHSKKAVTLCLAAATAVTWVVRVDAEPGLGFQEPVNLPTSDPSDKFVLYSSQEWVNFKLWAKASNIKLVSPEKSTASSASSGDALPCYDAVYQDLEDDPARSAKWALPFPRLHGFDGKSKLVPVGCRALWRAWKTDVDFLRRLKDHTREARVYCELAELDVVEQVVTGKKTQPLSGKKIEFVRVELDTEETCPTEVEAHTAEEATPLLAGEEAGSPGGDDAAGGAAARPRQSRGGPSVAQLAAPQSPIGVLPPGGPAPGSGSGQQQKQGADAHSCVVQEKATKATAKKTPPAPKKKKKSLFAAHLFGPVEENKAKKSVFLLKHKEDAQQVLDFCFQQAVIRSRVLVDVSAYAKYFPRPTSRLYVRATGTKNLESDGIVALTDLLYKGSSSEFGEPLVGVPSPLLAGGLKSTITKFLTSEDIHEREDVERVRAAVTRRVTDFARELHKKDANAFQKLKCELNKEVVFQELYNSLKDKKSRALLGWLLYFSIAFSGWVVSTLAAEAAGRVAGAVISEALPSAIPLWTRLPARLVGGRLAFLNRVALPNHPFKWLAQYFKPTIGKSAQRVAANYFKERAKKLGVLFLISAVPAWMGNYPVKVLNWVWPVGEIQPVFDQKQVAEAAAKFGKYRQELHGMQKGDYIYVHQTPNVLQQVRNRGYLAPTSTIGRRLQKGMHGRIVRMPFEAIKPDKEGKMKLTDEAERKTIAVEWVGPAGNREEHEHRPEQIEHLLVRNAMRIVRPGEQ
eukprot:g10090.t1